MIGTENSSSKDVFNKISFADWSHSQGSGDKSQPTPNINDDIPIIKMGRTVRLCNLFGSTVEIKRLNLNNSL